MTLMTGKGGKYRYYKCNTRIGQHSKACTTPAIPTQKLDNLVLTALADKVLTPDRLKVMLKELQAQLEASRGKQGSAVQATQRELNELETGLNRLYEAVERGLIPMDDMLGQRVQALKAQRESVLGEMARSKQAEASPLSALSSAQLAAFATSMRSRLLDRSNGFPKAYLQALVSEIVYDGEKVLMQGRKAAALEAAAGKKMGTFGKVPTFRHDWLPDLGSNQGPTD
ncbi:MAG: recombinase zinc beta ribbon domain-containing protein [Betaproteobacteria bacterium]|nr:recombinase zinc beta ribbon domain-containing protein [Betaproteobacteria bacterium]